ncbi:class I SAM-dependent methyltransferase [Allohahella sp. A8]|uniref:class I SAM-dependent methyltransferase n=1 Tax=Allohahella sp. A8 TaxID=3141461 RepID=UPI003A80DAD3
MNSICPLCAKPATYSENNLGIHCEGLNCSECGCNARNRFYYAAINFALGEFKNGENYSLSMLESSSEGYRLLKDAYIIQLDRAGTNVICADFYQAGFQSPENVDLMNIHFESGRFDIIASSHVLEHIPDDLAAISECYRVLRPGGVLVLGIPIQTDFTFPVDNEVHGDNAKVFRRNGWDVIEKLKLAGFEVTVKVPPECPGLLQASNRNLTSLAIDNIMVGQKFSAEFNKYQALFSPLCSAAYSKSQRFAEISGALEIFIARKPYRL